MSVQLKQKILDLIINSFEGDRFLVSKFDKALDEVLSSYPTCGQEQRKLLNQIEKIKAVSQNYHDPGNPTEYRDLVDLCKFYGINSEKVINGE